MNIRPGKLQAYIGGFLGQSYSVELSNDELLYTVIGYGYSDEHTQKIKPRDKKWLAFRKDLDSIGVWKWQEDYPNPGVCDGTQWSIEIAYDDANISSQGDNNYPETNKDESDRYEYPRDFRLLLKAIRALIGNRRFY